MPLTITATEARIICGQIRLRRYKTVLFRSRLGFRFKPVHKCSDREIGGNEFVGVYNEKVSYQAIQHDWNDTL